MSDTEEKNLPQSFHIDLQSPLPNQPTELSKEDDSYKGIEIENDQENKHISSVNEEKIKDNIFKLYMKDKNLSDKEEPPHSPIDYNGSHEDQNILFSNRSSENFSLFSPL